MALIKCSECGHMISDRASTCPQCGAPVEKRIQCPECGEFMPQDFTICTNCGCPTNPQKNTYTHKSTNNSFQSYSSIEGMSFGKAIKICFQKYAQFSGRASRGEFWYFYLFSILPSLCNWIITTTFGEYSDISMVMNVLIIIFNIAIIIPMLSVSVRRLHDINKSGWNMLWFLLPLIGVIILLIYWLKESTSDNQYGPSSKI